MMQNHLNALGRKWRNSPQGLLLPTCGLLIPEPPRRPTKRELYGNRPVHVDLFCGAGGFGCGFMAAGFETIAALDYSEDCALTFMSNLGAYPAQFHFVEDADRERMERAIARSVKEVCKRLSIKIDRNGVIEETNPAKLEQLRQAMHKSGDCYIKANNERLKSEGKEPFRGCGHFFLGDAAKVKGSDILEAVGLVRGEVDCVTGGPPCQGFSRSGKQDVMDPRNSLVFEFARLVCEIQPNTFIFENVPAILNMTTPEGFPVVDALCRIFDDGGMGAYDSIKKSLLYTAGAGAVLKNQKGTGRGKKHPTQPATSASNPQSQLEMFAEIAQGVETP